MQKFKRFALWAVVAVFIIVIAVVIAFFTNPKDKKKQDDSLTDSHEASQQKDNLSDSSNTSRQEDNLTDSIDASLQEDDLSDDNKPTEAAENVNEDLSDNNEAYKHLAFVFNSYTIGISDVVNDEIIESMLGKADEIYEHTYSADDGRNMDYLIGKTEKHYRYPGLIIKTIKAQEDDKAFIYNIEITGPDYPTVRGTKVGDSFEMLKETYPEGNLLGGELSSQEDDYRYEPVNYVDVMNFRIKDKKVESITMYTLLD